MSSIVRGIGLLSWAISLSCMLTAACSDDESASHQTQTDNASPEGTGGATATATSNPSPTGGVGTTYGGASSLASTTTSATMGGTITSGGSAAATGGAPSTGGNAASSSTAGASNDATGGAQATGGAYASGGASALGGLTGGTSTLGTGTTGGTASTAGASSAIGGASSDGGAGGSDANGCLMLRDFESVAAGALVQGWLSSAGTAFSTTDVDAIAGSQSLKAAILPLSAGESAEIAFAPTQADNLWPGSHVTLHVKIPGNAQNVNLQVYAQTQNYTRFETDGNLPSPAAIDDWTTLEFIVPNTLPGGIQTLGVELSVGADGTFPGGDVLVDAISSCSGPAVCGGAGAGSFGWEPSASLAGWTIDGNPTTPDTSLATTTALALEGQGSLKVTFASLPANARRRIVLANPNAYCGQEITFNVYVPDDFDPGITLQPFSNINGSVWTPGASVTPTPGAWNVIKYTLPQISSLGLQNIGLQLNASSAVSDFSGSIYIDDVSWGSSS